MQPSAFIIALFSLFALFSLALASPLPVQEAREAVVELSAREVPVEREILHREHTAELEIVARERISSEEYVTGRADLEPRICQPAACD